MLCVVLLVVAGIRAHSLALLSEAGRDLADLLALLLSLVAIFSKAVRQAPPETYGSARGVLAALVDALSLVVVSFFIFSRRSTTYQHPHMCTPR